MILIGMVKHSQNSQNSKFMISLSLQYLKNEVTDIVGRRFLKKKKNEQPPVFLPKTLKYWVGVPWDQSHGVLKERRWLFSFGWPPF